MDDTLIKKKRKRSFKNDICEVKNILESHGNIYVYNFKSIYDKHKVFISKIKEIHFIVDEELFRKGRENNKDSVNNSTPNDSFWQQRYYYYSRFDEGIKMDYESWYSVTPEEISEYIARNIKGKTVIDAFCGSGGNTIQFSKYCQYVYAIDIDPIKIDLCKNNTKVYECRNNIEFICSDFLKIKSIKADYIFLSPPWGGMDYKSECNYSLKEWIEPSILDIIKTSKKLSNNLIFYLPRNTNVEELFSILSELNEELDETLFGVVKLLKSANKIKAILVCFGEEFNHISVKDIIKYLIINYPKLEKYQINQMTNLTKVMGLSSFILSELNYRNNTNNPKINEFLKYMKNEVLTENELCEFKLLENKSINNNKSNEIYDTNQIIDQSKLLSEEEYNLLIKKMI